MLIFKKIWASRDWIVDMPNDLDLSEAVRYHYDQFVFQAAPEGLDVAFLLKI